MNNQSPPPADQPEARVLLADDSPVERQALAHLLRQAGYQVDEADDGEAAILFLKQRLPDILLLDLQMPGTDGFGVSLTFRKQAGLPRHPAFRPAAIKLKAIKRLPSPDLPPLLLKPVDPSQLNIVALRLTGELPS
jgi:response regulator NasT